MKNLKIGKKLLLGFGMVLIVFVLSVFLTWRYVSIVEYGNSTLVNQAMPAQELVYALNSEAYELFLAARNVQHKEDAESFAEFRAKLDACLNIDNEIQALHRENPALLGPQHVVNVVSPLAGEYIGVMEQTIPMVEKKRAAFDNIIQSGQKASDSVAAVLTELINQTKESARNRLDATATNSLLDAVALCSALMEEIMSVRRSVWHYVAIEDTEGMSNLLGLVGEAREHAENLIPFLDTPNGKRAMEVLLTELSNYNADVTDFITIFLETDSLYQARGPIMTVLNREISAAADISAARIGEIADENTENLDQAVTIMFVATLVAVLLGLVISFAISRGISKPMQSLVKITQRAGDGDLTVEREDFGYESRDEMGVLVEALSAMIVTQAKTLRDVVSVAESLSDGAGNLSAISEETNAAMEEVKASIDQVSALSQSNGAALRECNAGVDEMSSGANTVAESATESANFIAQTTEVSNKAIHTVNGVIEGMRDVGRKAKENEEKTQQLVESVHNVSSFVSVITGIADQTNLLALNAAIEAARAGSVGRGFAVVAEEVRKLAEESAKAAQNVNGIIVELQNGAQESIKVTTESGRVVGEILLKSEQAQQELDEALKEMNKANDSIQNIAAIAQEQAASSKEVAESIDNATNSTIEMVSTISNISRAADETSHAAESVAEQSEVMAGHVQVMTETLSHFKLPNSTGSVSAVRGPNKIRALAAKNR